MLCASHFCNIIFFSKSFQPPDAVKNTFPHFWWGFTPVHNEDPNKPHSLFKVKERASFPCKSSWNTGRKNKKKPDYSVKKQIQETGSMLLWQKSTLWLSQRNIPPKYLQNIMKASCAHRDNRWNFIFWKYYPNQKPQVFLWSRNSWDPLFNTTSEKPIILQKFTMFSFVGLLQVLQSTTVWNTGPTLGTFSEMVQMCLNLWISLVHKTLVLFIIYLAKILGKHFSVLLNGYSTE